MKDLVVAKRYATALLEVALEQGLLDEVQHGLVSFIEARSKAPLLGEAIRNEEMPLARRCAIIKAVCEVLNTGGLAKDFLNLLVRNGRIALVEDISFIYDDLAAAARELTVARVVVADETLAADVCARVEEVLEEKLGRPARCVLETDPGVVGGLMIKVGDRVIDASVRGRLGQLKAALLK